MNGLRFEAVDFAHDGVPALEGVSFEAATGGITAIMGPSGCGKSTLIALAAGLLQPDEGRVLRGAGRLAVAFQDPALLPWKTACDNVGFALMGTGASRAARRASARAMLAEVGLAPAAMGLYPRQLSGGMRQRVALARALAVRPDILLCDEPFSALDAGARDDLWRLLAARRGGGMTTLFVTHDREEAVARADLLVVMSPRRIERIERIGPPAAMAAPLDG